MEELLHEIARHVGLVIEASIRFPSFSAVPAPVAVSASSLPPLVTTLRAKPPRLFCSGGFASS